MQIAEFARISGITKIVLGRSRKIHRRHFWSGPSLTEKLTMTAPNLDIYIIPDASAENGYGSGRKLFIRPFLPSVRDLLITAGILSCITLIGFLFLQLDFARYNIITFYMLGCCFHHADCELCTILAVTPAEVCHGLHCQCCASRPWAFFSDGTRA